jgi:hypothetical protein
MKLGVSYNLFDGEELLESSIKSIRSEVDYISVVYQTVSNFGNPCSEELVPLLNKLKNEGLIDELFQYSPKVNKRGHFNEITKRNIGLSLSEGNGCTHHMSMDSDEFYIDEQFKFLKKEMREGGYDSSACQMTTYYKEPIYRLDPKEEYYVSLIYKINNNSSYVMGTPFPVLVDPTRRMQTTNCRIFTRDEIEMHHMSFVRKNITTKLNNSSANSDGYKVYFDKMLECYNNWSFGDKALCTIPIKQYDIIKVDNIFDININE